MGAMTSKTTIILDRTWKHIDVGDKGAFIVHNSQSSRIKYFECLPYTTTAPADNETNTIPFPDKKISASEPFMIDLWARSTTEADTIIDIYTII